MIFAGFSLVKLLSGFALWKGSVLGKLIFYAIIIAIGIGIYHKTFIAPTHTTIITKPEKVIVDGKCDKDFAFVGIKLWKIKLGATIK